MLLPTAPGRQPYLDLAYAMLAQRIGREGRQGDGPPRAFGLRLGQPEFAVDPLELLPDAEFTRVEVHVFPAQPERFSFAETHSRLSVRDRKRRSDDAATTTFR